MISEIKLEEYRLRWIGAQPAISVKIHPAPTMCTVSRNDMKRILCLRTIPIPEIIDELIEWRKK